ncbi:MAG: class I SAM-dependent methyltransferase [Candidatus Neomarinimicrobiota bacterium]
MKSLADIKFILRSYATLPLCTRLFVLVRYLVCPWDLLLVSIEGCDTVLDIGTGHGLFLRLARRRFPMLRGTGVDHDAQKIEAANKAEPQAGLIFCLSDQMDRLTPGKYSCVTFVDVLYSVPKRKWPGMLKLAHGFLRPGGTLIIKETINRPRWKYALCLAQETLAIKVLRYTKGAGPWIVPPDIYLELLEAAGFIISKHHRADKGYLWPHYLFVAQKR